jgi:hypothetical protein
VWAESIEADDFSSCITEVIFNSETPIAQTFCDIFTPAAIHDTDQGCLQHCEISPDAIPKELLPDNIINVEVINTPFLSKDVGRQHFRQFPNARLLPLLQLP